MPNLGLEIKRKCRICGKEFLAKTIESWNCSPQCSRIAYKRRKDEEARHKKLDEIVKKIPESRDYIKVSEAYALFGIGKDTIYRLIRSGAIASVNAGTKMTSLLHCPRRSRCHSLPMCPFPSAKGWMNSSS